MPRKFLINVSTHPPSALNQLKNEKAPGPDGIPPKALADSILPPLQICYILAFPEDLGSRESSNRVEAWLSGDATLKGGPITVTTGAELLSLARHSTTLSSKD